MPTLRGEPGLAGVVLSDLSGTEWAVIGPLLHAWPEVTSAGLLADMDAAGRCWCRAISLRL